MLIVKEFTFLKIQYPGGPLGVIGCQVGSTVLSKTPSGRVGSLATFGIVGDV